MGFLSFIESSYFPDFFIIKIPIVLLQELIIQATFWNLHSAAADLSFSAEIDYKVSHTFAGLGRSEHSILLLICLFIHLVIYFPWSVMPRVLNRSGSIVINSWIWKYIAYIF